MASLSRPTLPVSKAQRRRPRADPLLGLTWLLTAASVGLVGRLMLRLSESAPHRAIGVLLLATALLGACLGVGVLGRVAAVRPWSPVLSLAIIGLGIAAASLLLTAEPVVVTDVLLVGLPPIVGGMLTAQLEHHRPRRH